MYILAIDQGTTSSRVVLYNHTLDVIHMSQKEVRQIYPEKSWLEHDAEEIYLDIISLIQTCLATASNKLNIHLDRLLPEIDGIGITNQRETTILWDKTTSKPIHNAIVWQDRRTTDFCNNLKANPLHEHQIQEKTGLLIDPYFSASKIDWLLQKYQLHHNPNILFGTIDSYLIWRLTNGQNHVTDVTNASRTQLFNINTLTWDNELLELFNIPKHILPKVQQSALLGATFGSVDKNIIGKSIPIFGVAGDQQAAAIGQLCTEAKDSKITYGTGCFVLENTGAVKVTSKNKLITTIAYQINNQISYALEGSIFVAGAAVQWLRDALRLITKAEDTETIAQSLYDTNGVYLVPAFTGLGAPYWDPQARGAILGLTRDTGFEHIIRAALESVGYQTRDLLSAFENDYGLPTKIRVDGGMTANNWFLQFLTDITRITIEKPQDPETTMRGAALLAGLGAGIYNDLNSLPSDFKAHSTFQPLIAENYSNQLYMGWLDAISRVQTKKQPLPV